MSTVSVLFPQQPTDVKDLVPFGRLVQQSSARALWMGQSLRIESHPALAYLAGTGCQIPVGMAVGLMALRHPFDAALQARSLAALMDHPTTIGYGAADPNFVSGLHGAPYAAPAAAVEEYVTVARHLLTGERVAHQGRLFTVDQFLPPMSHPPVQIGAGVLRPAMARAAGRSADAAITWLTPTHYLRDTLTPMIAAAAAGAGRPTPRVVAVVHVALDRPGRSPMLLAQHGCGNHLQAPHYTDMLRKAGLDVHISDPVAGARELVEENVYVYGDVSEVGAAIRAHFAAGVDEVILNSTAVSTLHGTEAALTDLTDILTDFR